MNMQQVAGIIFVTLALLVTSGLASASDTPEYNSMSGDQTVPSQRKEAPQKGIGEQTIQSFDRLPPELRDKAKAAHETMMQVKNLQAEQNSIYGDGSQPPTSAAVVQPPAPESTVQELAAPEGPRVVSPKPRKWKSKKYVAPEEKADDGGFRDEAGGVRVFTHNLPAAKKAGRETFTLPSTSIALATLLYGIEATSTKERWVPAELNYAWLGPNGAVVEMRNCRLWIKAMGDYSTERIEGEAETMSCRTPGGETFDIPIMAHIVDGEEEYLGARGELVARGKALASALSFLQDGASAFGSAMASAQVQTDVAPGGGFAGQPVKSANVNGDKNKYIVGQTVAGSTAKFLDWWITYYQSLAPTIAIGPGKKIYLAVRGSVEVPKVFFGGTIDRSKFEAMMHAQKDAGHSINTNKSINMKAPAGAAGDWP